MDDEIYSRVMKMMNDREYILREKDRKLTQKTTVDIWVNDKNNCTLFVRNISDNIQNLDITEIVHALKIYNEPVKSVLKLYRKNVTFCVKNKANDMPFSIEFLNIKDLLFDITNHSLQPSFKKCNNSLKEVVIKKHLYKMPQMLRTDPIVKWFDWSPGDVISICDDKDCQHLHTKQSLSCKDPRFRQVINNII